MSATSRWKNKNYDGKRNSWHLSVSFHTIIMVGFVPRTDAIKQRQNVGNFYPHESLHSFIHCCRFMRCKHQRILYVLIYNFYQVIFNHFGIFFSLSPTSLSNASICEICFATYNIHSVERKNWKRLICIVFFFSYWSHIRMVFRKSNCIRFFNGKFRTVST